MISPPLSKNDIALAKNEIHLIKTPGKMQIAVQAFAWLLSYEVVGTSGKCMGWGQRSDFSCQIRSLCKKKAEARSFADASEQNTSRKWNGKGTGPIPGKSTDLMWVG